MKDLIETCPTCQGEGVVYVQWPDGGGRDSRECRGCQGHREILTREGVLVAQAMRLAQKQAFL